MTTRILAFGAALLFASGAGAQIIKVPSPSESRTPVSASVSFGFLQSQNRYDGQSGTAWYLGEGLQYRGSLELGMRSGSLALVGTLTSLPIARSGGTAPAYSKGDIELRQLLAAFRTPETEGAHQIVEVGLGLSQWANYSGTDVLTADEAKARNAFTLVVGYGFGFTIGKRAALTMVQDMATLWGSAEGLPAGSSRSVRQYTTRVGVRWRFTGQR